MALLPIPWNPDRTTLRQFSEFGMFVLGMVLAPLALWRGQVTAAAALWTIAVALRLAGLVRPSWLKPLFVGLTVLTWPIGWAVSHAALAVTYYLVITPMALVFRLLGRDALQRRFDRQAASYWEPYNPDRGLKRYLRQY
jgi:Gpi18-like mannosyltransferase